MKNTDSLLQASAPYGVTEEAKRLEKSLHRILVSEKGSNFFAGGKTSVLEKTKTPYLSTEGDPFADSWSNPLLMRGVPESQAQLNERAKTRSTLPTYVPAPVKPFYVTSNGNKSSVHDNDLFDTILDAEESGGVTNRHLAVTTSRFGLPDRADNRVPMGSLPAPPDKTILAKTAPTRFVLQLKYFYDLFCPITMLITAELSAHKKF